MKYLLFILLIAFSLISSAQKTTQKEVLKTLENLRTKYESLNSYSVDVVYSLYEQNKIVPSEKLTAKLYRNGKSQLLESNKHISLVNDSCALTINHTEKVILLQQEYLKNNDPLMIDIKDLLDMSLDYEALGGLTDNKKGYRFFFYDSKYESIDIIYDESSYLLKSMVFNFNYKVGKMKVEYQNYKEKPSFPSTLFDTEKYFIKKNNKIVLTNNYASYELYD